MKNEFASLSDTNVEEEQPEKLFALLEQWKAASCPDCHKVLCGHEVLLSTAMGFQDAPRCGICLANTLQREPEELRDYLSQYIWRRDCYRQAWQVACDDEQIPRGKRPSCLWPKDQGGTSQRERNGLTDSSVDESHQLASQYSITEEWDAGNMSCGDLVLALRIRMNRLAPRDVIRVIAYDPAAPEDLPAWCRLTGHVLLQANHPHYIIQRKEV